MDEYFLAPMLGLDYSVKRSEILVDPHENESKDTLP